MAIASPPGDTSYQWAPVTLTAMLDPSRPTSTSRLSSWPERSSSTHPEEVRASDATLVWNLGRYATVVVPS